MYKIQVYHLQGWISAVVLVDGRMQAVWELKGKAEVAVEIFAGRAKGI